MRRIVVALVARHEDGTGAPLTAWDLFEAGWPGEQPIAEAATNRVYVSLNRLRRMGLKDVLERDEEGYRIAPDVVVRAGSG